MWHNIFFNRGGDYTPCHIMPAPSCLLCQGWTGLRYFFPWPSCALWRIVPRLWSIYPSQHWSWFPHFLVATVSIRNMEVSLFFKKSCRVLVEKEWMEWFMHSHQYDCFMMDAQDIVGTWIKYLRMLLRPGNRYHQDSPFLKCSLPTISLWLTFGRYAELLPRWSCAWRGGGSHGNNESRICLECCDWWLYSVSPHGDMCMLLMRYLDPGKKTKSY